MLIRLLLSAIVLFPSGALSSAKTIAEIEADNTRAIVFIQVVDAKGQEIESGTGFIISHDGYLLTANHLKPDQTQKLVATIGQRVGTVFPLEFRDRDEAKDVALWQLPQASACRYATALSSQQINPSQHFVALGFPGSEGLSHEPLNITNTHSAAGFFKSDGQLEGGYSGGPVFNEDGNVIGYIQGGTIAGAKMNDIVPIAVAANLARKNGVDAGVDQQIPFQDACYSRCRAAEHGIEKWKSEIPYLDQTNKLNGGGGEQQACDALIAAKLANSAPGSRIDLLPGDHDPNGGMWEDVVDQPFTKYIYHCKGVFRSGPIYKEKESPACPLWN